MKFAATLVVVALIPIAAVAGYFAHQEPGLPGFGQGPFTEENPMERGHIIPLEAGGTNDPSNYRAECRRCNRGRAGS